MATKIFNNVENTFPPIQFQIIWNRNICHLIMKQFTAIRRIKWKKNLP